MTSIVKDKTHWSDEIKINLPPDVHTLHHLLITVYAQDPKKGKEVPLAYGTHILYKNEKYVN